MNPSLQKPLMIAAALGWGLAGLLYFKPTPTPKTDVQVVEKEVVRYEDRVVEKEVIRTVTKPDGTKIVTEIKSKEESKETSKVETKSEYAKLLPAYSVGASARFDKLDLSPVYSLEFGYRIGQSPLWVTGGLSADGDLQNKSAQLGLRVEF